MKDFHEDYYSGLKGIYFYEILKQIIKIGKLNKRNIKVLDFGCGVGKLKKLLGNKVVGYDVLPDLTEISDWRKTKFNVIVANEVFYLFSEQEIRNFLRELYNVNPNAELIVGMSCQGFLNRILALLSGQSDAHKNTKTPPKQEIKILLEKMKIIKKTQVFFMCNIYHLKFKNEV